MSKEETKILTDTINYLKFYKENSNYAIFESEIKRSGSPLIFSGKAGEKKIMHADSLKKTDHKKVKEDTVGEPKVKQENVISIKESLKETAMSLIKEDWMESDSFEKFADAIKDCPKCKLLARTRKQVVFGAGNPNADVVVVGEAPGADEDEQGKPFIGRAGKLLTDILKAINFSREEIFICNILKCRPPENRNPLPDEIANCEPYLFKQLEMIKPKLILAVGTFAAQTLLQTKEPLGKLRGKFHIYNGIKMMVTYHPAALLRNPNWKKPTWEDVQMFRKEYDRTVNS